MCVGKGGGAGLEERTQLHGGDVPHTGWHRELNSVQDMQLVAYLGAEIKFDVPLV